MKTETLPCPFCGSTNLTSNEWTVDEDHASKFGADEFSEIWAMECMDCLGSAPLVSWNRRVSAQPAPECMKVDPELDARVDSMVDDFYARQEKAIRLADSGGVLTGSRPAPPPAVPKGWKIEWFDEGEILIRNTDGTAVTLYREKGPSSYPAILLYDLCEAMLAAGKEQGHE